ALLVCAAVAAVFSPAFGFPFLNWDDQDVFARNAALSAPDFLRWAFTTTYMEHYQPLAWLVWGTLARMAGLTPFAVHTLNIMLHVACALLVFVLAQMVWADLNVGPYI